MSLLWLLFKHNAKSLNAQEEHLAASPLLVTRRHVPRAIAVRLHVCKTNFVISHAGSGGHSWCLSSRLSLSVEFSIQDIARSAPERAHYHADFINLIPKLGIKKGERTLC